MPKYEYKVVRVFDDDRPNVVHCEPTDDSKKAESAFIFQVQEGDGVVKLYRREVGMWQEVAGGNLDYAPAAPWTAPKPKAEPAPEPDIPMEPVA